MSRSACPAPARRGAQFDGLLDDGGDFVIVSLSRVDDGEVASLGDDETRGLRQALETDIGRTMFDGFVRGRRQSADIRIVEQNLES